MKALSTREQEFIINEVRENPCIWDLYCLEYRNVVVKDKVYAKIARQLQKSPEDIVKAWSALKEKYKREKEKENASKPRSGAEGGKKYNTKSWELFQNMRFLDKILIKKCTEESVSIVLPENVTEISSQVKSGILELESHSLSDDDVILYEDSGADTHKSHPTFYQSDEIFNRAWEGSSQNTGPSFRSSINTIPIQLSVPGSNQVISQTNDPSNQTAGPSFGTSVNTVPAQVSISTSKRVPDRAHERLSQTADRALATSNNTFPVSRKRKSAQEEMAKERQEFVQSISNLVKTQQDNTSKAIDSSMIQAFITQTAELTAHSMLESMKTVVGEGSEVLSSEERTIKAFFKYVETRFQQWGSAKRNRGFALITETLAKIEELEEDTNN